MRYQFQSTPPRRWWHTPTNNLITEKEFQSTPPRRWWQGGNAMSYKMMQFQSTPPRRWWRQLVVKFGNNEKFQSTPPRRWWHFSGTQVLIYIQFQSTPPRRWWQQFYTTIHTYIRQFSQKSSTATYYHLHIHQIHQKKYHLFLLPQVRTSQGFHGYFPFARACLKINSYTEPYVSPPYLKKIKEGGFFTLITI